jgi:hypothetical protein
MSIQPWDIRTDDSRIADTVETFIIFCEDDVSEPSYLRTFAVQGKVKVNAFENQKQNWINLNNTVKECLKTELIEPTDGGYRIKPGNTTHVWSVYDRDMESEVVDETVEKNDLTFTTAIQSAKTIGINVAWSNDVFELWLLLHFEPVAIGQRLHRDYVYERLTAIFKGLPNQTPEMLQITTKEKFYYKDSFKKGKNFVPFVLPLLTPERRSFAIKNAQELEATYSHTTFFHHRNPCTTVHHLVNSLLRYA